MSRHGGAKPDKGEGQEAKPSGGQSAAGGPSGEAADRTGRRQEQVPSRAGSDRREGWGRYLVAPRPMGLLAGGVPPLEASALFKLLEEDAQVEPVAQLRPPRSSGLEAIAGPYPVCPPVAVVKMPEERARTLAANPQLVVEIDQPLTYTPTSAPGGGSGLLLADPLLAVTLQESDQIRVLVRGSDGKAVPDAQVWAVGAAAVHGVSGEDGRVSLRLAADTPATLRALYVRPESGYWPARIDSPQPTDEGEITVEVTALAETFEGFPERAVTGWGVQAMRLHQLPPTYRGHGIKIALLDSGVHTAHPDLKDTVQAGRDFTGTDGTWQRDSTGNGTRCAGIIAAADNHTGITGIAAEAELHALKLFPGGRVSDLLQAIDYCLEQDIDIAQISLAYALPSQLVAWKVMDAHAAGITLIAPAGDTAGPVTYPAALPGVLSVGALAHTGAYPATSPLASTRPPWPGFYPAPFTPIGPGIDLAAPGTAVLTTTIGDGYTPADGTSLAAAHVTALAALLLAHHDHLRTHNTPRTPTRAGHLLTLLRTACRPLPGTHPQHLGAGIADAPTALGTPTPWQQEPPAHLLHTTASGSYPPRP
ncbi:S8 family serine peptidase [Streptomyces cinereoruber]|uniref:S8 family serine peptidase n=1 Tax=Streptomyces cinereoruber TaxID=67260 RepID=UPI003667C5E7